MKELIQIQCELKAPKNQYNSFGKYKYRSCEDILEAVKPLLLKYGCTLTIYDRVNQVGDIVFIESNATIYFKDGGFLTSTAQAGIDPNRKGMDIAQSFGSSSSYARKYALSGLLLIEDSHLDPDASNDHSTQTYVAPKPAKVVTLPDLPEDKWLETAKWIAENKSLGLTEILKRIGTKYSVSVKTKTRIENELKS